MILIDVLICRRSNYFVTKSPIFILMGNGAKYILPIVAFILGTMNARCQYRFSGHISDSTDNKVIYLSVIEDYRKASRTYLEQIIKTTETDSTGFFEFQGDNLLAENRIYKIHIDECSESITSKHFFGSCENTKSVLFIANVRDTIYFPTTFNDQIFCAINSTNPSSDILLNIDLLKEDMIYDFTEFRSEANRKLNSKKWFSKFQNYGVGLKEPLAELYIYEFLSDRRNEIYDYYLMDVQENPYYDELLQRLQTTYPMARFTQLYESDITTDKHLGNLQKPKAFSWMWILASLLLTSLLLNGYLIFKRKSFAKTQKAEALDQLTEQEQKIVSLIAQNKTNKEIATELFISVSTVKTHINNLYKKLNANTRSDLKHLF